VLSPSGSGYTERVLYGFQGGNDGEGPQGALLLDRNGALYGVTSRGGVMNCDYQGCGVAYQLVPSSSGYQERVLYRFSGNSDDAQWPQDGFVADSAGTLYGVSVYSGGFGPGIAYALTKSGKDYSETVLHTLDRKSVV
jgi:hypothetical protein